MSPLLGTVAAVFCSLLVLSSLAEGHRVLAPVYVRADSAVPNSGSVSGSSSPNSVSTSLSASTSSSLGITTSSQQITSASSSSHSVVSHTHKSPSTDAPASPTSVTTTITSSQTFPPSLPSSAPPLTTSVTSKPSVAGFIPSPQTTIPVNAIPSLDPSPNVTNTDDDGTPTDISTNTNVHAASTGFWNNKGAVGGTFTVIALIIVGGLAALVFFMRKRAQQRPKIERDTFYDAQSPSGRQSPGPSMASLGNEPMDAHSSPVPNYGFGGQYLVDTSDNAMGYPPGTSYAPAAAHANAPAQQYYSASASQQHPPTEAQDYSAGGNTYDNYTQYYSTNSRENGYSVSPVNRRPSVSPHPYSNPTHTSGLPAGAAAFAARDSYQPSIDSFYGAAGTAL